LSSDLNADFNTATADASVDVALIFPVELFTQVLVHGRLLLAVELSARDYDIQVQFSFKSCRSELRR